MRLQAVVMWLFRSSAAGQRYRHLYNRFRVVACCLHPVYLHVETATSSSALRGWVHQEHPSNHGQAAVSCQHIGLLVQCCLLLMQSPLACVHVSFIVGNWQLG
jgi:hypothetical protein